MVLGAYLHGLCCTQKLSFIQPEQLKLSDLVSDPSRVYFADRIWA